MKRTTYVCLLVCAMLFPMEQYSQTFSIATDQLGISEYLAPTTLGCGVSVMDLDQNGWDDIFFGNSAEGNIICYFNDNMQFTRTVLFEAEGDFKTTLAADYDNDGDQDILVTRDLGELLLLNNDGSQNFTNVAYESGLEQSNVARSWGATWFDIDNDGWLDLYISNYNYSAFAWEAEVKDWFYRSNGDGTFSNATNDFGFFQTIDPTFQASAFPYNDDEFLDLYVINDYNRPNKLFISDENGFYTSAGNAIAEPVNFVVDAMSSCIADYDNDGDFDIYVTNTQGYGNVLLENQNGQFVDVGAVQDVRINRLCIGAVWMDVDNDLRKDLYTTDAYDFYTFEEPVEYQQDILFKWTDDGFQSVNYFDQQELSLNSYAVASGDLNKDGFVDLVISASLDQGIQVLLNNAQSGMNSVRLNLEGVISNKDAIGTQIDYYMDGNRYREIVQCGSDYLNQNSNTLLLACGEFQQIDSLFLKWSSGLVDKIYAIPAGNEITVFEGQSLLTIVQNATYICPGQSVQLSIDVPDGSTVIWNQSQIGKVVSVDQSGEYYATVISPDGFTLFTDSVFLDWATNPEITATITSPSCWGYTNGSIELLCESCQSYLWENVIPSNTVQNIGAGIYTCAVTDVFGCESTHQYLVEEPAPFAFFYSWGDASCFGNADGFVKFDILFGDVEPFDIDFNGTVFYDNLSGQEVLQTTFDGLSSGEYYLTVFDGNGCSYSDQFAILEPDPIEVSYVINQNVVELTIQGGIGMYDVDWGVPGVEGTLAQLENGFYTVVVTDIAGCEATVQFQINYTNVLETGTADLKWWVKNDQVEFDQFLTHVEVYDARGRRISTLQHIRAIDLSAWSHQMILLNGVTQSGEPFLIRTIAP